MNKDKFVSGQESHEIEENASEIIEGSSERVEEVNEAEESVSESTQATSDAEVVDDTVLDEAIGKAEPTANSVVDNIKSKSIWLRLFFMLVIALLYSVSRLVVGAVVMLQFFFVLFTGKTNNQLLSFGQALSTYTYQVISYLTFNTEERPFPFDTEWPKAE
ncbi:MAG TPA: hypothetical protein DCE61_07510 [Cellvibrionales bacterium]|jgi:hypothetical protein|nr:hypothetical protein [Cellvibrionales bacterium]